MKTNGKDLAYPLSTEELSDRFYDGLEIQAGLTKREYFAAMAFQGLIANCYFESGINDQAHSEKAVQLADALIEALNK